MNSGSYCIGPSDLLSWEDYHDRRKEDRQKMIGFKRERRLLVGPFMTFSFESRETVLFQIQEMIYIEKAGSEQILEEIEAYTPLLPEKKEEGYALKATMMIEIPNPERRHQVLQTLGHVEDFIVLKVGGEFIQAQSLEDGVERTTPEGKTSSVHFLKFFLSLTQKEAFQNPSQEVSLRVHHPHYGHEALLPLKMREALSQDF